MNNKNLEKGVATQFESGEKAAASGRKGGYASGVSKRQKKAMRETLEALLVMSVEDTKSAPVNLEDIKSIAKLKGANISAQEAIMFAQMRKAMKGDTKAAEFIRDTIGQKPTDKTEITGTLTDEKNKLDDLIRQMNDE